MAIDTALKRASAIDVSSPWRGILPVPDTAVTQPDRQAVPFLYSGILASVASGSTVVTSAGVSAAGGVTYFKGVSRPTIQLADAGGGTFTVTKTYGVSGNLRPDTVDRETYIIDGELP